MNVAKVVGPIVSHLAEWKVPHVELAIHGTHDAVSIAEALDAFCTRELQCAPAETLFLRSTLLAESSATGTTPSSDERWRNLLPA